MPPFEFSSEHQAFVKKCSGCNELFIGVRSQTESETIFSRFFHSYAACDDGFHPRCKNFGNSSRNRLGVTRSQMQRLHALQGGQCAVCEKSITSEHGEDAQVRACVDHDEQTGIIRGLLCNDCNRALGFLKHDQGVLEQAIRYLDGTLYHIKQSAA